MTKTTSGLIKLSHDFTHRGIIVNISRVPERLSFPRNWDPHPLTRKRVCLPLGPKGGQNFHAGEGMGRPNLYDWTESLALCTLWTFTYYDTIEDLTRVISILI
jgi:hypothetical protein